MEVRRWRTRHSARRSGADTAPLSALNVADPIRTAAILRVTTSVKFYEEPPEEGAERTRKTSKETEQIANFEKKWKGSEKTNFRSEKPRGLTQEPITQKPWDFRGRSGTSQRMDIKQNKNFAQ